MSTRLSLILGVVFSVAGCAMTPGPVIDKPITARAVPQLAENTNTGAIYQTGSYRPIFEDIRARAIGDTLIITIAENTNSTTTTGNATSKSSSTKFTAPNLFGASSGTTGRLNLSTTTANSLAEKGGGNFANTFNGTISVTITDILPNGNYVVSGEKKLAFDRETEYVRFSGVVAPTTIAAGNIVSSTQVADAKFEYRTNAHVDGSEMMSILSRFFLSVIPL